MRPYGISRADGSIASRESLRRSHERGHIFLPSGKPSWFSATASAKRNMIFHVRSMGFAHYPGLPGFFCFLISVLLMLHASRKSKSILLGKCSHLLLIATVSSDCVAE